MFVAQHLHGRGQHCKLHTLFLGVLDFLFARGQFRLAPAIDKRNAFRAQTKRATRGVHSYVSAAHYCDAFAALYGRCAVLTVCLHKIDARQELVGGIHAF